MKSLTRAVIALAVLGSAPAQSLETVPATVSEMARHFRLDGVVEAVHQSTVAAQTSAQVEEVLFDIDDHVDKGEVIVVLRNTEQQAGVDQASASLQAARARLAEAEAEYGRVRDLFDRQLVSRQDMDRISATRKTARAALAAAEAGVSQASQQLEYTRIRAPYSGIVTERHVQVGEVARPGTPLMSGISLEELRVAVKIPQSIVHLVREHRSAGVEMPNGEWVAARKVTVFPVADAGSGSFSTRLDLPPGQDGLFPGMYVKAAFVTGMTRVLTVPARAVVTRSEVTGIYALDRDGGISFRHIRPGRTLADGRMTILSGLDPGEQVILDPAAAVAALKSGTGGHAK